MAQTATSPATFNLSPGTYTITASLAGYRTKTETVTIADGDNKTVEITLDELKGTLVVTTTPSGASVTVEQA